MARSIAKDHDDKRRIILKGAAKIFAIEGFDRASMSSVAGACAISKANIYHYYASKDDILFDILDTYLASLRDQIIALDDLSVSCDERYLATLNNFLHAYHGADYEHKLQINELDRLSPAKSKVLRGYQSDLVNHMSEIIKLIAPDRFQDDETQLRVITMSVFGMLNWFYMWNRSDEAQARSDYARTIFDLTTKGIRA